jgi:hypothetical protein
MSEVRMMVVDASQRINVCGSSCEGMKGRWRRERKSSKWTLFK